MWPADWPRRRSVIYVIVVVSTTYFCSFSFFLSSLLSPNLQMLPAVQNVKGARPLSRVQISTMAVKDNLMVAGGFQGELICKVG